MEAIADQQQKTETCHKLPEQVSMNFPDPSNPDADHGNS